MQLRPYQAEGKHDVYNAWDAGAKNVLLVEPTGAGKTVIFSDIIHENDSPSCAIAHRQELVSQISMALARNEVRHRIVGPTKVIRTIVNYHMLEFGKSYYDPSSFCGVAGVDTLIRRKNDHDITRWLKSIGLWVLDEGHHCLKDNKWGKAAAMMPNAKGLLVTATPDRADGKGLGRHADGLADIMVEGPTMRDLINKGYLTDYRIFAPKTEDLDLTNVDVSKVTGDYNPNKLKTAIRKSHIVGDVVEHYLRIAPSKLGITFATDVETATEIAAQFNAAGVPAAIVSADTSDFDRIDIQRRFKARELLQIVNVDIYGEGVDIPDVEVVSMARPTKSYGLYVQQFGRALRILISKMLSGAWDTYTDVQRRAFIVESKKPKAIIIDHVSNVDTTQGGHGLPDAVRKWSLDRREKRTKGVATDVIPVRVCPECISVYERIYKSCPHCGHIPIPSARSGPEFVDGDLTELDPETLAAMRGEIARIDGPVFFPRNVMDHVKVSIGKKHLERQEMQKALRASMAWWAGYQRSFKRSDDESYRRFYFMFGIDVMSAQALNSRDGLKLANQINHHLGELANG